VVPGFPWTGRFSTVEKAREYASGESIQCLICGKHYKALASHINRIHKVDESSYKQQFGIPYTVGLVSAPTAQRHAKEYAKISLQSSD
jgi:predicted transcriptional regulator